MEPRTGGKATRARSKKLLHLDVLVVIVNPERPLLGDDNMPPAMEKVNCQNCLEEFEVMKKRKARFCSKGCATSFRQKISDPDFMSMEDELKFYLLGLILTDGCISHQPGKIERMTLRTSDQQLAELLHPIISPQRKMYENKPLKEEHNISYALVNTNEQAIESLKSYGIYPNKSYTVDFPNIPENAMHHFIRGVFDGDGSISRSLIAGKYPARKISFTSASLSFAESLKSLLESKGYSPYISKDTRKDVYYVYMYKKDELSSFANWIYQDAIHYLHRKHAKFFDDIV